VAPSRGGHGRAGGMGQAAWVFPDQRARPQGMIWSMSRRRVLIRSLIVAATLAGCGAAASALVDSKNHLVTAVVAGVAAATGAVAPLAADAYRERKRAIEKAGSIGRSPGQWKNLPSASPSAVLDPHREVIPFAGRDDEIRKLVAWCNNNQARQVRLITGAGGVGKTRLAIRLVELMTKDGWECRWITQNKEKEAVGTFRNLTSKPLLLIVDYAEIRLGLPDMLQATANESGSSLRVLLLARQAGDWWEQLRGSSGDVRNLIEDVERNRMELPEAMGFRGSAVDVIRQAIPLFAKELGSPAPDPNKVTIIGDLYSARVLDLHASAVIAVLSYRDFYRNLPPGHAVEVNIDINDVLRQLLGHEKEYWVGRAQAMHLLGGPHGTTTEQLSQVVAAGCLLGAEGKTEMMDLLRRVPEVEPSSMLATWLHELYPSSHTEEWLGSLRPDRLAELHVTSELDKSADLATACLTHLNERQAVRALVLLARASSEHEAARRLLEPALFRFAEVLPSIDAPQEGLIAIAHAIPNPSLALAKGHAAVVARILETFPSATRERASWLITNSALLRRLGRPAEALAAADEATAIYRRLSKDQPGAFLDILAAALVIRSVQLSILERRRDALTDADEAITICRKLQNDNPYVFLRILAISLRNQSRCLSAMGRWEDALDAAGEAVVSHRTLAQVNPDVFSVALVSSLDNQSQLLSAAGQKKEALAMADEAVKISRETAGGRRDTELTNLAGSLEIQSQRLSDVGQPEKALDAATEAVTIRRRLVDRRRDAYLPALAGSLMSLSRYLSRMDRRQEALDAVNEAVTTYRELTKDRPDAFSSFLANALDNQSQRLSRVGKSQEALDAATEAVTIRRRLASEREMNLAGLAASLENQAQRLSDAGQKNKALDAATEAVTIRRQLAEAGLDLHESAVAADQSGPTTDSVVQTHDNSSDL